MDKRERERESENREYRDQVFIVFVLNSGGVGFVSIRFENEWNDEWMVPNIRPFETSNFSNYIYNIS